MITRIDQRLTSEPPPARRADVAAVLEELEQLARVLAGAGIMATVRKPKASGEVEAAQ